MLHMLLSIKSEENVMQCTCFLAGKLSIERQIYSQNFFQFCSCLLLDNFCVHYLYSKNKTILRASLIFSKEGRFFLMRMTNFAFEKISRSSREDRPFLLKSQCPQGWLRKDQRRTKGMMLRKASAT